MRDIRLAEDHVFVAGNGAAVKWTAHARAKNGADITFEGIDVLELNETGQIQLVHAYWDPAPVLAKVQGS